MTGAAGGLPAYFSLGQMSRSGGPNFLGAQYAPFVVEENPDNTNFRVRDVAIPRELSEGRFEGRKDLRKLVDRMVRINDDAAADPVRDSRSVLRAGHTAWSARARRSRRSTFSVKGRSCARKYGRNGFGQRLPTGPEAGGGGRAVHHGV